ncbi:MAG: PilZ domain-containing protein [Chromatiaceae bacterium]|nr:PilZ domain-containing protein [Gammaproteobacteria bacterium]MCB1872719.1 PilZ domain-containing protein [Gammaproteobacteria bacterium]MCB1880591.1 PilZ domain-containing protein [Gammaproteobacteria bacterium]MCP5448023.1 PilZ domain-containing protein [Chromatiaceae bacterium]
MTQDRDKREHVRTPLRTSIRLTHESFGELLVKTRDISHGGVFLLTGDLPMPPVGTIIEGQVQDGYGERPVVKMEIVRVSPGGVGLMFIE